MGVYLSQGCCGVWMVLLEVVIRLYPSGLVEASTSLLIKGLQVPPFLLYAVQGVSWEVGAKLVGHMLDPKSDYVDVWML